MIKDRLERIRDLAYALWERAGGGHGAHESHWHQASSQIDEEDAKLPRAPSGKKAARPKAVKVGRSGIAAEPAIDASPKKTAGAAVRAKGRPSKSSAKADPKPPLAPEAKAELSSPKARRQKTLSTPAAATAKTSPTKPAGEGAPPRKSAVAAKKISGSVDSVGSAPVRSRGRKKPA